MVFASITFLYYFFPIFLFLYFIFVGNIHLQNIIITIFSLIFYAWGEPIYVILLVISSLINYICGRLIGTNSSKVPLFFGLIFNIALIVFFKYLTVIFKLNIPLPIGISFYTFQSISYLVDVYRKDVKPQSNFINLLLYISMFPQLIAGPIVKYKTIEDNIYHRTINIDNIFKGIERFVIGIGKKVIIANTLGAVSISLFNIDKNYVSLLSSWGGIALYTLQIYFDFSGYSDIAIGIGKIIGFDFPENFNYPYIANSITNFWRRWHITLSTFFKDYVFMPLCTKIKNVNFNLFVVWLLTGLWHGSSINFVIWGLFYYVILIFEKRFILKPLRKLPKPVSYTIGFIYTMFLVLIANTIFYNTNINELIHALSLMFFINTKLVADIFSISIFKSNITLILLALIFITPATKTLNDYIESHTSNNKVLYSIFLTIKTLILICIFIISTILLIGETNNPFLYTQF